GALPGRGPAPPPLQGRDRARGTRPRRAARADALLLRPGRTGGARLRLVRLVHPAAARVRRRPRRRSDALRGACPMTDAVTDEVKALLPERCFDTPLVTE